MTYYIYQFISCNSHIFSTFVFLTFNLKQDNSNVWDFDFSIFLTIRWFGVLVFISSTLWIKHTQYKALYNRFLSDKVQLMPIINLQSIYGFLYLFFTSKYSWKNTRMSICIQNFMFVAYLEVEIRRFFNHFYCSCLSSTSCIFRYFPCTGNIFTNERFISSFITQKLNSRTLGIFDVPLINYGTNFL